MAELGRQTERKARAEQAATRYPGLVREVGRVCVERREVAEKRGLVSGSHPGPGYQPEGRGDKRGPAPRWLCGRAGVLAHMVLASVPAPCLNPYAAPLPT